MSDRGTRRLGNVSPVRTGEPKVDRALDAMAARANSLPMALVQAVPREVKLVAGLNKVPHGLGVPVRHAYAGILPTGVTLTSEQTNNLHPESQFWLRMTGADRATVLLIFFPVT